MSGIAAADAFGVTIQAAVEGTMVGVPRSDAQGPAGAGSLLAQQGWPEAYSIYGKDICRARAGQDDAGRAGVFVDGWSGGGAQMTDRLEATTAWSNTVTNNGATRVGYRYQFMINGPLIQLTYPGKAGAGELYGQYGIVVTANDNVVFESGATLSGTASNPQLETTGTDLNGMFTDNPFFSFQYQFSDYQGSIHLGNFEPGESVTVTTTLSVEVGNFPGERGALVHIGDPLKLGSDPGVNGVIELSEPIAVQPTTWTATKLLLGGR